MVWLSYVNTSSKNFKKLKMKPAVVVVVFSSNHFFKRQKKNVQVVVATDFLLKFEVVALSLVIITIIISRLAKADLNLHKSAC